MKNPLRVFTIGNSFASNATEFLPQLAAEGGHSLELGGAKIGGCSLQKHWELHQAGEKPYDGQSLCELISNGDWDIVTLQQASIDSSDLSSYQPYAQNLRNLVREIQPNAEIVWHQTWAYHADSPQFGQKSQNQREMWELSRAAYHAVAAQTDARIIPVGDAFWAVNSDPNWSSPSYPDFEYQSNELPEQTYNLHRGFHWYPSVDGTQKIGFDGAHATNAGCYLGALVWYGFLFGESPEKLKFVPPEVPANFAEYLREVACETLQNEETNLILSAQER